MSRSLKRWIAPLAAALAGMVASVLLFYPGWMSHDSAVQYAQALGTLPLDDVHPPLFALLWRASGLLLPGPAGLFLLLVLFWWLALAVIAAQCLRTPWRAAVATLLVGGWPAALLMLAHLWKDVAMAVALLLAVAGIVAWRRGGRPWACAGALLALAAATAFRHNGVFAALPLLAWLLWPRCAAAGPRTRWCSGALFLACALLLAATPTLVLRAAGGKALHPWTAVLLWDLAPLSLAAGHLYYPPGLVAPNLTLGDLRGAYVPWSNVPLFGTGKIALSFYVPFTSQHLRDVRSAWWRGVREQPRAYLEHRLALARHLLLGFDRALPRELVYTPTRVLLEPGPLPPPPVDGRALAPRLADRLRDTPLFAGVLYLVLAAAAVPVANRRRRVAGTLALAASAWATALPLLLISGSAEFRYLLWSVLAALLAWVHALGTAGKTSRGAVAAGTMGATGL